ncbi:MAG TPA: 30S ribosomal protein S7 [Anaerolineae bacterium]|nr:30S ribosomal protein S7 [Anaerolineae bacterium]HQH37581.1 30S ribosomal protein S7 [Anaerolineae bacterium]
MPRRNRPFLSRVLPDTRYHSASLQRFINRMMRRGKKSVAQRIMYQALDRVEARTNKPGLEIFDSALRNVAPAVEIKPRRVGGATYQIPVEVPPYRQLSLAIRWLLEAAQKRSGHGMVEKLSAELIDASNGVGAAVKKREDTLKMAEANRAFAHLRW